MKKLPIFASLGLIVVLLTACSGTQEFKSDSGKFSVQVPQPLAESVQTTNTESGKIDQHVFTADVGKTTYLVAYADYPPESVKGDPQKVIDLAITNAITNVTGQLISSKSITVDGNSGTEIFLESFSQDGQAVHSKVRFFMVGNRLYEVMGLANRGEVDFAAIDGYLNSFKILP